MTRLAAVTQLGPWGRGESDSADCDECDWSYGNGKARIVEYAARRHVIETRHVVAQYRTWNRGVFLADDIALDAEAADAAFAPEPTTDEEFDALVALGSGGNPA